MKVIPLCGCSKDALQERLQVLATAGSLSPDLDDWHETNNTAKAAINTVNIFFILKPP